MNVEIDSAGMREFLNSDEVCACLDAVADDIAEKANEMAMRNSHWSHHGGVEYDPYRANKARNTAYSAVANVATATKVGMWDSSTNSTLMKAKAGYD